MKRIDSQGTTSFTARVRRAGHTPRTATFRRKADAQAWIREHEDRILGTYTTSRADLASNTLHLAISRYLAEHKTDLSRRAHLRRWDLALGTQLLREINYSAIREGIKSLKPAEGRTLGGELSQSSIRVHLCSLSIVFKMAMRWGWVTRNPVDDVEKPAQSNVRVRYLSQDELSRLLIACRNSRYPNLYLIVILALSTGMRKEEILSLTWKQVDLERERLILEHTINGQRRSVPLKGRALELIKEHVLQRRSGSDFLFPGEKPSPKKPCRAVPESDRHFDITAPWTAARKEAKISDFRFHDLRHTTASYLAMNGASLIEIAGVLGHKQLQTVHRYAHLSDDHLGGTVERMNRRFLDL